eukprot:CCRYP_014053-RA/>CCRYP_014053-RA protein AED:0.22 eAED:0.22 QI:180/1/1/1/0.5/0.33/3/318/163
MYGHKYVIWTRYYVTNLYNTELQPNYHSTTQHHCVRLCHRESIRERPGLCEKPIQSLASNTDGTMPLIALVVDVIVKEDSLKDFLDLIEKDAIGARQEPGCLRFDAVQSADDPLKFYLYELYVDEEALAYHNEQPYLKDVVTFVQGGGATIEVKKAVGKFMTD